MAIVTGLLENVEIHWAHIREPNAYSGKYEVEIHNLTKDQIAYINSFGAGKQMWTTVNTSEKYPEKGKYVKLKCAKPPKVVDGNKVELPNTLLIGNGTIANVLFLVSEPKSPQGISKVKLTLNKIQIVKLVEYNTDNLPVVKGGYTVDGENKSLDKGTLEEVD